MATTVGQEVATVAAQQTAQPLNNAVLYQLLERQQAQAAAQQRALQQLITTQELTAIGSINTAANTKRIKQIQTIRLVSTAILIIALITYALYIYISISQRYKDLIAAINGARAASVYGKTSAFFLVLAYEYPILARLQFQNSSFPAAVVYGWYTNGFSESVRANFNVWIQSMYNYSQQHKNADGATILCKCDAAEKFKIPQCFNPCPGPSGNGPLDYATSAFTWGAQGAFVGSMVAPGVGTAIGGALGIGFGALSTFFKGNSARNLCGNQPECVDSSGNVRSCS